MAGDNHHGFGSSARPFHVCSLRWLVLSSLFFLFPAFMPAVLSAIDRGGSYVDGQKHDTIAVGGIDGGRGRDGDQVCVEVGCDGNGNGGSVGSGGASGFDIGRTDMALNRYMCLAAMSVVTSVASVNYWRDARFGWRRNVDLIVAKMR